MSVWPAAQPEFGSELPALYVACPLTSLDHQRIRLMGSEVAAIKRAVIAATEDERPEPETWPVAVYAPIDHSAPWNTASMTASEVYRTNLQRLHDCDGLIVLAEDGGSAGVGQELEWAVRSFVPVLYLTPNGASRQVQGTPGVECRSYCDEIATLESHVAAFMRHHRDRIVAGPQRRSSRRKRLEPIRLRLWNAWTVCRNRAHVAATCGAEVTNLDIILGDGALFPMLPVNTMLELARELRVPLDPYLSEYLVPPLPAMEALVRAAHLHDWSQELMDRLVRYAMAMALDEPGVDLSRVEVWEELAERLGT